MPAIGGFPNNGNAGVPTYDAVLSNSGVISFDQNIILEKFMLSGGTFTGTFSVTANAGVVISGDTSAAYIQGNSTVINAGGAGGWTADPDKSIWGLDNGRFLNAAGAIFAVPDATYGFRYYNGAPTFENAGTLTKSTGSGVFNIGYAFKNTGIVSAQSGTIALNRGGYENQTGAFNAAAGASVQFAGNFVFAPGSSFTGDGNARFISGTSQLNGNNYPISEIKVRQHAQDQRQSDLYFAQHRRRWRGQPRRASTLILGPSKRCRRNNRGHRGLRGH